MQFSVIVPVYNVEKYLRQCIDSIVNQDISKDDYEIILVDDGSKDDSGNICDWYRNKHQNIKVIHKKNGGLSDARNCGVRAAEGDYILFVDSDDYIALNSLINIQGTIINNNEPELICLECCKFYDNSNILVRMNDGIGQEVDGLEGDELYEYLAKIDKFPASACTKAVKRSFLIDNCLFFEMGKLSEDLEWGLRLFSIVTSVAYYSGDYYYRQARTGSISNSATEKNMFHILDTLEKGFEFAKEIDNHFKYVMICSFLEYIYRLLILYYNTISRENRNEYRNRISNCSEVLGFRCDLPSRIIRFLYNLFGINITNIILSVYMRVKKR